MAISNVVGNFTHNVRDSLSTTLTTAKTQIENIVGSTSTSLSNVWSGGFTGMSDAGMSELKTQLTTYCQEIEDLIESFDQSGDITSALKGDVQTATYDFIAAIKTLLKAYVSTMKQEIAEADEAYNNFLQAGQSISQDVNDAASDIRSNASSIRLD